MRLYSNLLQPIALSVAILFLTACGAESEKKNETVVSDTIQKTATAAVVLSNQQEQEVLNAYLALKNALVKSSSSEVQTTAAVLAGKLELLKAHEKSAGIASNIASSTDLKVQRKEFTSLSNLLIEHYKKAAITSGSIFIQHCPMANNGDGGDWLSSEKKIQNPYYGSEMLECGAVLEEIKAK